MRNLVIDRNANLMEVDGLPASAVHGQQIGKETYKNGWKAACKRAGFEGKLVHDFRRTAVRNLEFAGVERSTSMKITGHLTESVFRRYAIVNEEQFTNASERLQRLHDRQNAAAAAAKKDEKVA